MASMDNLERDKVAQVLLLGIMFPVFTIHTIAGISDFFSEDLEKCRTPYEGEFIYIIVMMFSISMIFVFILLLCCVLVPVWLR